MSHPARHPLGRLALPLIASLGLGLAALPVSAIGGAPAAHAAAARQVARAHTGKAKHLKAVHTLAKVSAIMPPTMPAPSGPGVVTSCTSTGLLYALNHYATITFACPALAPGSQYTIDLGDTFEVPSGEALSIDGSDGGRNNVSITGGATVVTGVQCDTNTNPSGSGHQLFLVDFGGSLTLRNLTLTHGYAYNNDASGGAVEAFGNLTADRDTFSDNGAEDYGGALELATESSTDAQTSTVTNSTFDSNYTNCDEGGAIDIDNEGNDGPQQVTLGHDTFSNNIAYDDDGGAIYADNDNNTVPAAILLTVGTSVFRNNQALEGDDGGAIFLNEGNASIADTLFDSNYAGGDEGDGDGGAVFNDTASEFLTTIARSTFVQNRADDEGGAIYNETPLRITNATITQNSSGFGGSAIYDDAGEDESLTIAASTINANVSDTSTDAGGAAIVNDGDGTLAIGTSIVYDNTTLNEQVPEAVHARAVHASVVPAGTVLECEGTITDNGANLSDLDVKGGTANSCGFTQTTAGIASPDILVPVGTSIGLGPLGAYGGPVLGAPGNTSPTFTERLLAGSPAINGVPSNACKDAAGGTLPVDERGFVRPYVALCDIGAFEVSTLAVGNGSGSCGVVITFFAPGGTQFALRTGDGPTTLLNYLSINGPGGLVQALPLVTNSALPVVPNSGAVDTLSCVFPDPNATPLATTTTVTVDARVVRSRNAAIPAGTVVRVVAVRTATSETVTVSAINADNSTGATLYTLTPYVQPQSFVVSPGIFTLYTLPVILT